MTTKIIPTEFEEVEQFIPTDFIEYNGRYIPTEFEPTTKYISTKFKEIEIPTVVPK